MVKYFHQKRKGEINNVNAKRVKRRKQFRGSMRGKALRGNKITYGEYGIVATEQHGSQQTRSKQPVLL